MGWRTYGKRIESRSRRLRNRSGQALVEFALTVPILLFLVVGIIEFGRLMSAQQTITDTAREAARRAVVADAPCSQAAKKDAIHRMIRERLAAAGLDSTAVRPVISCAAQSGQQTTVALTYAYPLRWLGPLIGWENISLESETHMRQE